MVDPRRPIRGMILLSWAFILVLAILPMLSGAQQASRKIDAGTTNPGDLPGPLDDVTIRPTVLIRDGNSRGSGTIIGSNRGRALILTAAHVIDGPGDPAIELHRYNLGIEGRKLGGTWPKVYPARVLAADSDADVAVLLVEGLAKLPYVAQLDPELGQAPSSGSAVTSVGIDQASDLNAWNSRIRGTALLSRNRAEPADASTSAGGSSPFRIEDGIRDTDRDGRGRRLFLITEHAPIQGRSGGGLFSEEGRLLGLCVGRIEVKTPEGESGAIGLFASGKSILRVLDQLDRDGSSPN
jgi:S1-C subfamily serine protease